MTEGPPGKGAGKGILTLALLALIIPTLGGEERTPRCTSRYVWARALPYNDGQGPTKALSNGASNRGNGLSVRSNVVAIGGLTRPHCNLRMELSISFISTNLTPNCHMWPVAPVLIQ